MDLAPRTLNIAKKMSTYNAQAYWGCVTTNTGLTSKLKDLKESTTKYFPTNQIIW